MEFLNEVKLAMGITTNAMDNELSRLIVAGFRDLNFADVVADISTTDPAIKQAVITYVRLNFDSPDDYQQDKAQLKTSIPAASSHNKSHPPPT